MGEEGGMNYKEHKETWGVMEMGIILIMMMV